MKERSDSMRMFTQICVLATLPVWLVSCKTRGPEAGSPLVVENSIGMPMRYIEAGSFMMGSTSEKAVSDEFPVLKTSIDHPFYIGVYEVTREDWLAVMGPSGADTSSGKPAVHAEGRAPDEQDESARYPVDSITWLEAKEFCRRLSEKEGRTYRLPTEAEWEYACRAGSTTEFYWGDTFDTRYAWVDENSGRRSHPVGLKLPNAWGLYDMAGNQKEWCEDVYRYKRGEPAQQTSRGASEFKVVKGSGWKWLGEFCRSSQRFQAHQNARESKYGFRVVCLTSRWE